MGPQQPGGVIALILPPSLIVPKKPTSGPISPRVYFVTSIKSCGVELFTAAFNVGYSVTRFLISLIKRIVEVRVHFPLHRMPPGHHHLILRCLFCSIIGALPLFPTTTVFSRCTPPQDLTRYADS